MRVMLCLLFSLAACASLPAVDAQKEYTDAVRRLDLNPVYPPRQSLRVGDVFYQKKESDGEVVLEFIGHLDQFEKFAANYDRNAYPIHLSRQVTDSAGKPFPFSDNASVMPIAFPSISVSAASAVGLGSTLPGGTGFLNFGRAKTVSIGFENARQFGLPDNVLPPNKIYSNDLKRLVGQNPALSCETMIGPKGETITAPSTIVAIVTRIIITNLITFTSSTASGARAGAAIQSMPASTGSAIPPVNLNISIPSNASAAQVQEIMAAAAAQTSTQNTLGTGLVTTTGSAVTYSKPLDGYVAIAYYPQSVDLCKL